MKTYKYVSLTVGSGIIVESTDIQVLEWITATVKKHIPACQVDVYKLPSGEAYCYRLHRLQNKDPELEFLIRKQLLLQGWQPFAITSRLSGGTSEGDTHHLRFEVV